MSLILGLAAGVLVACSSERPRASEAPGEAIRLAARLVSPIDVVLEWQDPTPNVAGHIVEYATEPEGEFTTLEYLPPGRTTAKHPDLVPQTTFYYRVRAFSGPVSGPVEIALPAGLSDADYAARFGKAEDYSFAPPRVVPEERPVPKKSIRDARTAAGAGPTDLRAALVPTTVSGFKLTWTDRASDEDGFLLEMQADQGSGFTVAALIEPDVNAFGHALEPPARRAAFRVRAFYFGRPSNVVRQTTGPEPSPQASPAGS